MEKNHYIHYTAADLLNDGTFLDSMQHPTEQSEKFWSQLEKEMKLLPENYVWPEAF